MPHFLISGLITLAFVVTTAVAALAAVSLAVTVLGLIFCLVLLVIASRRKVMSQDNTCLLYTSPSPRDRTRSRMPSSA